MTIDLAEGNNLLFDFAKRNLSTAQFQAMIASAEGALQLVEEANPAVKAIGLVACDKLWNRCKHPEFIELVMSIVTPTTDSALACTAMNLLRSRLAGSNHHAAKTLLARVALDESYSEHARATAYGAFWAIVHGSDERTNTATEVRNTMRQLENKPLQLDYIDWHFVRHHANWRGDKRG